tara:strand:+ start:5910 stop:6839 length:930 start_codon:yes stop_codon:yes gene_type:complete
MKSNIYVIGSSNTDMVIKSKSIPKPGETVIGGDFFIFQGGKGANQAVAAAKLGGNVLFISKVGKDSFGEKSIEEFKKHKIKTKYIKEAHGIHTGVALIMVDEKGENSIAVSSGANADLRKEDVVFLEKQLKKEDIVLVQLEISLEVVNYIIRLCHKVNSKLILNPAPFQKMSDESLHLVDTITPNILETHSLTGVEITDINSARKAAQSLLEKKIKNVLITMGSKGVFYMSKDDEAHVPARKVEVADSTAAGDTFNGAYATGLSHGMDLITCIEFANAAAAISVTRMGAQDSVPSIKELDKKFQKYVYS